MQGAKIWQVRINILKIGSAVTNPDSRRPLIQMICTWEHKQIGFWCWRWTIWFSLQGAPGVYRSGKTLGAWDKSSPQERWELGGRIATNFLSNSAQRKILSEDMNKGCMTEIIPCNLWKHICACQFGVVARLQLWDTGIGGLDRSCRQASSSLTASGSGATFPIGQKALRGIIEPMASQLLSHQPMSLEVIMIFCCLGERFGLWVCPHTPA